MVVEIVLAVVSTGWAIDIGVRVRRKFSEPSPLASRLEPILKEFEAHLASHGRTPHCETLRLMTMLRSL